MPKVIKSSIQNNFKGCPTLRVFQYENSKKYYCMFYVGGSFGTRGTIIRPTKEHNRKFAITKAKEEYRNFFLNNKISELNISIFFARLSVFRKLRLRKLRLSGHHVAPGAGRDSRSLSQ